MPWPVYLALKQLFPSGRRWSLFFVLSVTGVALGVFIVLVVQSVMGGFGATYREKIIATNGQVRVAGPQPFIGAAALRERLLEDPGVAAASPYAEGLVLVTSDRRTTVPFARGIDPVTDPDVLPLDTFLIQGSLDALDDGSALLSVSLASNLGVSVGDVITLATPLMIERLQQDEVLLPTELRVAGIYQTGWNDFDTNTLLVTLRVFGELSGHEGHAHGLALRLRDGVDEEEVAARLQGEVVPSGFRVLTWQDQFGDFLWVLALEKNMMFFLLMCVVLVAAFTIANAQLLAVVRKTREIGLLGAMGARPAELALAFCVQGAVIGVAGVVAGIGLAVTVLHFRNDIVHAFSRLTGSEATLVKFYQFAQLPVQYDPADFVKVSLAALVLSLLAGVVPALRAARLKPADALRAEA